MWRHCRCAGHVLRNRSDSDCVFVAGGREETTDCHYTDIDTHLAGAVGEQRYKDGSRF